MKKIKQAAGQEADISGDGGRSRDSSPGITQADRLSHTIKRLIRSIPAGRVATYGQIAVLAGNPRASRAVFWILSSSSAKEDLPWHRVINREGDISLKPGRGFERQQALLRMEKVAVDEDGRVDLQKYQWQG